MFLWLTLTSYRAVSEMKNNNAPGYDGICSEHIQYGGAQVLVHLCLLFSAMIAHFYTSFGIIVPLLKDKHGDATRLDMYRGITMSSAVSLNLSWLIFLVTRFRAVNYSLDSRKIIAVAMPFLLSTKQSDTS